jgi:toxin-antitoxin system PIN domain toxin
MILPDLNLLMYAYNRGMPQHEMARSWWEDCLNGNESIGLPWTVALGFVRLCTHRKVLDRPWTADEALDVVESWRAHPLVTMLDPGPTHLPQLRELLEQAGTAGPLTTDAHLAALAIEHGCRLYSNDADFGRFEPLVWRNPLR